MSDTTAPDSLVQQLSRHAAAKLPTWDDCWTTTPAAATRTEAQARLAWMLEARRLLQLAAEALAGEGL